MEEMQQYWQFKPGVKWINMDDQFKWHLSRWASASDYVKNICGGIPTITSAHDSVHSVSSMHYIGKAVDIRINDWVIKDIQTIVKSIAWILGDPWLVLHEIDHLHIQISSLNISNPKSIITLPNGGRYL